MGVVLMVYAQRAIEQVVGFVRGAQFYATDADADAGDVAT